MTPASRYRLTSLSTRLSFTVRATRAISTSWFTRSKNFSRHVDHPPLAAGHVLTRLQHRVVGAAPSHSWIPRTPARTPGSSPGSAPAGSTPLRVRAFGDASSRWPTMTFDHRCYLADSVGYLPRRIRASQPYYPALSRANPGSVVGPSAASAGLLCPLHGSATPLDAPCRLLGRHTLAVRPPRVRTPTFPLMPAAYTSALSVQVLDFESFGPLIQRGCLLCGSCSSGQRFVSGFLQIPPRDGHPCLQLTVPPAGPVEDLACSAHAAPPGVSPCRAQQEKGCRETPAALLPRIVRSDQFESFVTDGEIKILSDTPGLIRMVTTFWFGVPHLHLSWTVDPIRGRRQRK